MGSSVLILGAGPTGLVLAQLLRQNGGCNVVIAAPEGLKMELAKNVRHTPSSYLYGTILSVFPILFLDTSTEIIQLGAGDTYIELSRKDSAAQFKKIKEDNPYGFDIVVEATGSVTILEDAINYVRRGGKLVVYGVYSNSARVSWPPSKIFGDEITIIGSFSETYKCESNPVPSPTLLVQDVCLEVTHGMGIVADVLCPSPGCCRLSRFWQDQGQGYRQQDLQARTMGRVPREHARQECHQGCHCL